MTVPEQPLVSVILPCYDAARFLRQALDSLLAQTYRHLEILTIDDGSRDGTLEILREYAQRDERIRVLVNEENLGLISTLNRGVAEAHGELIARMDADDVATPARLERQVETLARRPEVGAVSSGYVFIDDQGRALGRPVWPRCIEPGAARFMALLGTPLAHPALVARAEVLRAHPYGRSPDSLHTEDYELFARLTASGVELMNVDEPLMSVRVTPVSVSRRFEEVQVANFVACARRHFERTMATAPGAEAHKVLVNRVDRQVRARELREGLRWLDRVEQAFATREPAAAAEIHGIAAEQRVDILIQAGLKGAFPVRLAAGLEAARRGRRLLGSRARRYLSDKPGRRRYVRPAGRRST